MKPTLDDYVRLVADGPHGLFSQRDLSRLAEHALDGAAGASVIQSLGASSIIDVGSGGGVPGLPLAITLSGCRVHLVESQRWKAEFLEHAAHELGLSERVSVHPVRAEQAQDEVGRARVDCGVARALAQPIVVCEYLAPLVRVGGHIVLWTTSAQLEAHPPSAPALAALGIAPSWRAISVASALRDDGVLCVLERIAPCEARFPRRVGVAAKRPL